MHQNSLFQIWDISRNTRKHFKIGEILAIFLISSSYDVILFKICFSLNFLFLKLSFSLNLYQTKTDILCEFDQNFYIRIWDISQNTRKCSKIDEILATFQFWSMFLQNDFLQTFRELRSDYARHSVRIRLKFPNPNFRHQSKHKEMFQNRRSFCNILNFNHVSTIRFSLNFQGSK